jgi:hypothetical protein
LLSIIENYLSTAYPSTVCYRRFIGTVAALSSVTKMSYIDNGSLFQDSQIFSIRFQLSSLA